MCGKDINGGDYETEYEIWLRENRENRRRPDEDE